MKYAVISDIHSNLEALKSCLDEIKKTGVDGYLCAGDIVGYGANPRECLEKVRALDPVIICGNHDWGCCGRLSLEYFNDIAKESMAWTESVLSDGEKDYLRSLELRGKAGDIVLVHSTLVKPQEFDYIQNMQDARKCMDLLEDKICFVGHSHVPVSFSLLEGKLSYSFERKVEILPGGKYIVNIGSIGQPRDGNPRASFAIYDTSEEMVSIIRVEYDVALAQKKIKEAGIPEWLANRLEKGR